MKLGLNIRPLPVGAPSLRAHAIAGYTAPARLVRNHVDYRPGMFGNDEAGDCTCVAIANAILAQVALSGYRVGITTAEVLALYSAVTGYDPARPVTDTGAYEVDVLRHQAAHGFQADGQTAYVGLWGNIGPGDLTLARVAMSRFGSAYLALNLAQADQQGTTVWDTDTPVSYGDPTPGSWGGHAVLAWDYTGLADSDTVRIVTWGRLQRATWRWFRSRVVEVHAIWHPQLAGPGHAFQGVDVDRLRADMATFGSVA